MSSPKDDWRKAARMLVPVGVTFLVLLALTAALGYLSIGFSRWPLLVEVIGALTVLVGLFGLYRKTRESTKFQVRAVLGDVALILGGGILVGGGWGAALGLGIVAAAGLMAERDRDNDEADEAA